MLNRYPFLICALIVFLSAGLLRGQEKPDRLAELLAQTKSEKADEQVAAFLALIEFRDQPDQLLVPLVEAMIGVDTHVGEAAQVAAEAMGQPLIVYCDQLLDSEDAQQVAAAAEMIHRLGNAAICTTPKLVGLTKSDDARRRLSGVYGLVNLKNTDPSVVDALEPFLDDADFRIQVLACRAIVTIGAPANRLSGKLKKLVDTGNLSSRSHALTALGAVGTNPDFDVVEILSKHLDDYLQPDRDRALIGLMHLGEKAAAAKDKVESLMKTVNKFVQCQAALTLWKITGQAEPSIQALLEMQKTIDLEYDALFALYQMKADAVSAAPQVAEQLKHEDSSIRAIAAEILENLGSAAAPWQADLEKMASEDSDPLVRFYAARTLKGLVAAKQ